MDTDKHRQLVLTERGELVKDVVLLVFCLSSLVAFLWVLAG